jgi:predicted peptidase
MRNLIQGFSALVALATLNVSAAPEPAPNQQVQSVKEFNFHKVESATLKYLLFLPKGYDGSGEKRWPLMLFLHGAGERGNDIWKVTTHGPPKNVAQNPDFPFILVSPQCLEGEIWSKDSLLGLLDDVTANLKVDTNRVYLTGLSMGGYGTWDLGLNHPERFAAIVPICGGGELITVLIAHGPKAQAMKSLGVWAFHGAKDPIVPPDESQRMVNVLKKIGTQDVKLTIYPEAGHDAWTETYNNPELYQWLLAHERK